MQLNCISFNVRVPEVRSFIGFEVTEFFQEPGNLYDDSENILIRRMVVHGESFNSLVVLNDWVETFFFEFLPVLAEFVLVVVVEHE